MTYRIELDRSLCSGFGSCAESAPGLFRLDESGTAEALADETAARSALDAAASCPMGAIAVFDAEDGAQLA